MKIKKILIPLAALVLVIATMSLFLTGNSIHSDQRSPETKNSITSSLERLLPVEVTSVEDTSLVEAVKMLRKERYIAAAWLVNADGMITVHDGGPGKVGDLIVQIGEDTVALLAGLPEKAINSQQYMELVALGALRAEGEHNDVFGHLVKPLFSPDGSLIAMVVVAYDLNPQVNDPGLTYKIILLLGFVGLLIYWLALPLWVALDARDRGEPVALWTLFVFLTNLVGLLAYLIALNGGRTKKTN